MRLHIAVNVIAAYESGFWFATRMSDRTDVWSTTCPKAAARIEMMWIGTARRGRRSIRKRLASSVSGSDRIAQPYQNDEFNAIDGQTSGWRSAVWYMRSTW